MLCRLSLFGLATLLDGKGRPVPVPAKTFALTAFLILSGDRKPATRSAIRQFLWPSADQKTAAANLRKFLARVRERQERFGIELIRCERGYVELVESARIDLDRFLKIVTTSEPADILTVCEIYRGDLLEGMGGEDVELGEWMEVQRTKLRDAFASTIARLLGSGDASLSPMTKRVAARRLIEVDPYNESGHRALMRLFADEGETAHVREIYFSLRQRLRVDLGAEPDAATKALFESLPPERAAGPRDSMATAQASRFMNAMPAQGTLEDAHFGGDHAGVPKLTILPPPPISEQDHHHHIAASLVEDIVIGLCRFRGLSVVAPHTATVLSVGGKQEHFRNFNIDYAVETQLQDRGGEIWLAVKLVNAKTRRILWVEQYEFNRNTISRQYRELSVRIVLLLVEQIERIELARYEVEPDATAYHLFLKGQRYLRELDLPNVRRARREFKSAINAATRFLPAIGGLARTYQREWLLLARGENELLDEAERLARLAIEIDPDDARGYRELGICTLYSGRFDESLEAMRQAEICNPQFADLLMDHADALTHACSALPAIEKITQAIELNPLCPDPYWWTAGGANFHLQRYADAIACMSRMRDPSPAYRLLAASSAMLGDREQAADYVRKAKEIHPDFSVSGWLSIVPLRDPKYAAHYESGLREAGFS